MTDSRRLLDVSTVARRLEVSTQTIRNWIRAGKLEATRAPNGRFRIQPSALTSLEETILQNLHRRVGHA